MSYYYNKDGKNIGPVSMEELKVLAEKGEIGPKTPVIESGEKVWMRWEDLSNGEQKTTEGAAPIKPHLKTGNPTGLRPTSLSRQSRINREEGSSGGIMSFFDKITQIYEKIDAFLMKIYHLPDGIADTPEACERKLRLLSAPMGICTLLCTIFFCLTNKEVHKNFGILILCIGIGCILQYLCYQIYNAMIPLLFGKKIRLSSIRIPKMVAMVCAVTCVVLILSFVLLLFGGMYMVTQAPELQVGDLFLGLSMLFLILFFAIYFAGVGYVSINSHKLFVIITPKAVVPGREMVNYERFFIRVTFMVLHALTPVLMLLTTFALLTQGSLGQLISMVDHENEWSQISGNLSLVLAILTFSLPLITFFSFCLSSMIPDFMETIFAASDHGNNNSDE